jgi:hypothetical protein
MYRLLIYSILLQMIGLRSAKRFSPSLAEKPHEVERQANTCIIICWQRMRIQGQPIIFVHVTGLHIIACTSALRVPDMLPVVSDFTLISMEPRVNFSIATTFSDNVIRH